MAGFAALPADRAAHRAGLSVTGGRIGMGTMRRRREGTPGPGSAMAASLAQALRAAKGTPAPDGRAVAGSRRPDVRLSDPYAMIAGTDRPDPTGRTAQ
ncbi:hypothetical protein ACFYWU_23760 [Streptomyces chrestomyceticus]|uniref:hypothetical protein n=1 Tax=Streptomyces chrestomyceticus TaxID=68185 RepID=UPI000F61AB5E|nr:hypothetical protein [Streptomyces chrestomyceticus]